MKFGKFLIVLFSISLFVCWCVSAENLNTTMSLEGSKYYDYEKGMFSLSCISEDKISITTEKIESQKGCLKTTIQYPKISGLADSQVQTAINAVFEKAALDAQNEGQKNAEQLKGWMQENGNMGFTPQCETYFDYSVPYQQNGLLSVILTNYQYAGGAHGSTIQSSYTFDLSTGKILSLSDLMNQNSGYSAYVNSVIRKEIDKRVASGALAEFQEKFKDIGANPVYYLSPSGIVFYFQQYEYFPYAAGIQEFNIPYHDLKSMLKQEYKFLYSRPAQVLFL